jgi:hypothetical protein
MSVYIGWFMGATEADTWSGEVLVQGLSDSVSSQWARMRVLVRPSEVLGAYADASEASASLVRRVLLVGCRVELNSDGDTVVRGSQGLSKPVVFKPCGEAPWREAFHAAMAAACAALDPLGGLVIATLPGMLPEPTLCTLSLTSNKQRPIMQLLPVTVWGLEQRARPARGSADDASGGGGAGAGGEGAAADGSAAGAGAGAAAAPAEGEPQLCGKVHATPDPATGEPRKPIYLKLVADSALTELAGGAFEITNVRTIYRTKAAFGLLSYKAQGPWVTLHMRAVDMERDDDADLFFPPVPAAAPPATFLSALGLGNSGAAAAAAVAAAATSAATATDEEEAAPPTAAPILDYESLLGCTQQVLELLASSQSVVTTAAKVEAGRPVAAAAAADDEAFTPRSEE